MPSFFFKRKGIAVPIIVKNVYEKDVVFYFTLDDPKLFQGIRKHLKLFQIRFEMYSMRFRLRLGH